MLGKRKWPGNSLITGNAAWSGTRLVFRYPHARPGTRAPNRFGLPSEYRGSDCPRRVPANFDLDFAAATRSLGARFRGLSARGRKFGGRGTDRVLVGQLTSCAGNELLTKHWNISAERFPCNPNRLSASQLARVRANAAIISGRPGSSCRVCRRIETREVSIKIRLAYRFRIRASARSSRTTRYCTRSFYGLLAVIKIRLIISERSSVRSATRLLMRRGFYAATTASIDASRKKLHAAEVCER